MNRDIIRQDAGFVGDDFTKPWAVALHKDDNWFHLEDYPDGYTAKTPMLFSCEKRALIHYDYILQKYVIDKAAE